MSERARDRVRRDVQPSVGDTGRRRRGCGCCRLMLKMTTMIIAFVVNDGGVREKRLFSCSTQV